MSEPFPALSLLWVHDHTHTPAPDLRLLHICKMGPNIFALEATKRYIKAQKEKGLYNGHKKYLA